MCTLNPYHLTYSLAWNTVTWALNSVQSKITARFSSSFHSFYGLLKEGHLNHKVSPGQQSATLVNLACWHLSALLPWVRAGTLHLHMAMADLKVGMIDDLSPSLSKVLFANLWITLVVSFLLGRDGKSNWVHRPNSLDRESFISQYYKLLIMTTTLFF